jgi:hypothetical protein
VTRKLLLLSIVLSAALYVPGHAGVFTGGRDLGDTRDFVIRGTFGQISELEAMVQETTRSYYDTVGESFRQADAENYNLNDFGLDDGYATVGISLEKAWNYFTFQFDANIMNPKVDTVAQRNYYIGIGEAIEYGGSSYHNMKIPEGTRFTMDILSGTTELRGLITPFTFRPIDSFRFTPWIDTGLFMFLGQYDLDAGPSTGVAEYLRPVEYFVVGGQSKGFLGMGLPELGLGGEFRIGTDDGPNIVLQGHYAVCEYEGSTGYLTSSKHREKNVDLEHVNYRARCSMEFPFQGGRAFVLGVQYQHVESEASITASAETPEEIIATQERFDKEVQFKIVSVSAMAGFTF